MTGWQSALENPGRVFPSSSRISTSILPPSASALRNSEGVPPLGQEGAGQEGTVPLGSPAREGSLLEEGQPQAPGSLPVVKGVVAGRVEDRHLAVYDRLSWNGTDGAGVPLARRAIQKVAIAETMKMDAVPTQTQLTSKDLGIGFVAIHVHDVHMAGPAVLEDSGTVDLPVDGLRVADAVNRHRCGPVEGVGTGGPADGALAQNVCPEVAGVEADAVIPEEEVLGIKAAQPVHIGGETPVDAVG